MDAQAATQPHIGQRRREVDVTTTRSHQPRREPPHLRFVAQIDRHAAHPARAIDPHRTRAVDKDVCHSRPGQQRGKRAE